MADTRDLEARLAAVEAPVEEAAADAAAARHIAAAGDRDLADLTIKVEANRRAINALGVQTAARFDRIDGRLGNVEGRLGNLEGSFGRMSEAVDTGFTAVRGKLDQTAAGLQQIIEILTPGDDA